MKNFKTIALAGLCLLLAVASAVQATKPGGTRKFKSTVLPILQAKCFGCHGADVQEADIRLDNLSTDFLADRAAATAWHEAMHVLNKGEMPPEEGEPLTAKERSVLVNWIRSEIDRVKAELKSTGGRVVLRRLNRTEYQNTMKDLFDLEMDYARDLPREGASPDGFKNNGQSLQMTAIQLEYYLDAARRALDRVIVTGEPPEIFEHTFEKSNVGDKWFNYEVSNYLGRWQGFYGKMVDTYPEEGDYLVTVTARAELPKERGAPLMEVSVGYRPDTEQIWEVTETVEITQSESTTYEFTGRVENHPLPVRGQGKFPGLVVRVLNQYDDEAGKPKEVELERDGKKKKGFPAEEGYPIIHIEKVTFKGPVYDQWPPQRHRDILFDSEMREIDEQAYVALVMQRFLKRAFRRPATQAEVQRFVDFYLSIRGDFPGFEEAMKETLAMVLISPPFLYLVEPSQDKKRDLDDWELASRLSYFLWSTMPDQELFDLAAARQLSRPAVLAAQVERMLQDDRGWRFYQQFTDQWLKLENTAQIAIDTGTYKGFQTDLKEEMLQETRHFLRHLILNNLSGLNLLDADFTMLNERLARHYGVEGVVGNTYRQVALTDETRGGLLGQSSILMLGSTGKDSHPIRRAVWLRDRLLNDPPAPPPPDVPDLDEMNPNFAKLSVREQLEVHRNKESCASCHRGIDPWGIALENFDAIGLFRTEVHQKPVVATDTLPNGTELDGVVSLKKYLVENRSEDFARALVSRLTVYALGRNLELSDEDLIDDLTNSFERNNHLIMALIQDLVASEAFQTK
ncbi:MAG: DUF1592 domain-containing protein [Pirellulales bacterium]|jgi:hypothetical protein|nr:hypothetical protein [Rhodopirellula sp.]MCH2369211.1 DUF1592 domain-containing protein [Pirellulales bacterium]|tara:strand:+ start:5871 stop:8261 length:2391 start_codon:yes stop_codon:yes gene_type:complete